MPARDEIIAFLDGLLDAGRFADYGPNGLQVPGRDEVRTVATGVSGHLELFERAAEAGADLVLVHHGILWDGAPRRIDGRQARRLRVLLQHEMSLAAYHLPLDAHPEHGNNALLADALGATRERRPFGTAKGVPIGVAAAFDEPLAIADLVARVRETCGQEPLVFPAGPDPVASIGIVSGGAARNVAEAADAGLDAFLTGEPTESAQADAREGGVTFVAAGHHATETFGIRRLGELLERELGVEHVWIDVPNPV